MPRDLDRLADTTHDLLVIGGGIHGLFTAWLAASRGLTVALIDRADFGGGLSFNHQRTIHGGLRALESANVMKVREQIAERRVWATLAPAHICPVPFLLPLRRGEKPSRLALWAGLRVYDALAAGRHAGLPAHLHLGPSQVLSADAAHAITPDLPREGLVGAAAWSDYQTVRPDRLNWLVALAASGAGALLANYVEARAGRRVGSRFAGVEAVDVLSGRPITIQAHTTVIAAGSGLPALLPALDLDDTPPPLVAAANLLVARPAASHALAVRGPSGRRLTAIPWAGYTLLGTFQGADVSRTGDPFPLTVPAMLAEANAAFPWLHLSPADVRVVHRGLVPAVVAAGRVDLMPDAKLIRHDARGVTGVVSVVGVKFTTARLAAAAALDVIRPDRSPWASAPVIPGPLPFGHLSSSTARLTDAARNLGIDDECLSDLCAWYGDEAAEILDFARQTGQPDRLSAGSSVLAAEILYAAHRSLAPRLADVVLRRTRLGMAGRPAQAALDRAADLMAGALGWSADERAAEIAVVDQRFAF